MFDIDDTDEFYTKIQDFVFDKMKNSIAIMLNTTAEFVESNNYISLTETKMIVDEIMCGNERVSKAQLIEICDSLNKRIYNNVLMKLSSEGFLDCAFSEEDESFVFKLSDKGIESGIIIPSIFE
jgi:hypothetical protein